MDTELGKRQSKDPDSSFPNMGARNDRDFGGPDVEGQDYFYHPPLYYPKANTEGRNSLFRQSLFRRSFYVSLKPPSRAGDLTIEVKMNCEKDPEPLKSQEYLQILQHCRETGLNPLDYLDKAEISEQFSIIRDSSETKKELSKIEPSGLPELDKKFEKDLNESSLRKRGNENLDKNIPQEFKNKTSKLENSKKREDISKNKPQETSKNQNDKKTQKIHDESGQNLKIPEKSSKKYQQCVKTTSSQEDSGMGEVSSIPSDEEQNQDTEFKPSISQPSPTIRTRSHVKNTTSNVPINKKDKLPSQTQKQSSEASKIAQSQPVARSGPQTRSSGKLQAGTANSEPPQEISPPPTPPPQKIEIPKPVVKILDYPGRNHSHSQKEKEFEALLRPSGPDPKKEGKPSEKTSKSDEAYPRSFLQKLPRLRPQQNQNWKSLKRVKTPLDDDVQPIDITIDMGDLENTFANHYPPLENMSHLTKIMQLQQVQKIQQGVQSLNKEHFHLSKKVKVDESKKRDTRDRNELNSEVQQKQNSLSEDAEKYEFTKALERAIQMAGKPLPASSALDLKKPEKQDFKDSSRQPQAPKNPSPPPSAPSSQQPTPQLKQPPTQQQQHHPPLQPLQPLSPLQPPFQPLPPPSLSSSFTYSLFLCPFSPSMLSFPTLPSLSSFYLSQPPGPVASRHYLYRGRQVHSYSEGVYGLILESIKRENREREGGREERDGWLLKGGQEIGGGIGEKGGIEKRDEGEGVSESAKREGFKYAFMKVGLDQEILLEDIERLDENECKMFISFCNVKFGIHETQSRLSFLDERQKLISNINRYINDVLQRANNFKKNEEFLKKKWKEFLKYCRLRVSQPNQSETSKPVLSSTKAPTFSSRV